MESKYREVYQKKIAALGGAKKKRVKSKKSTVSKLSKSKNPWFQHLAKVRAMKKYVNVPYRDLLKIACLSYKTKCKSSGSKSLRSAAKTKSGRKSVRSKIKRKYGGGVLVGGKRGVKKKPCKTKACRTRRKCAPTAARIKRKCLEGNFIDELFNL